MAEHKGNDVEDVWEPITFEQKRAWVRNNANPALLEPVIDFVVQKPRIFNVSSVGSHQNGLLVCLSRRKPLRIRQLSQ